jgi:hypothetical protein
MGIPPADGHGVPDEDEGGCMAAGVDVPGNSSPPPLVAGLKATGEFRCAGCGYGISIYSVLPRCPMCGTESWEQLQWGFAPPLRSDN